MNYFDSAIGNGILSVYYQIGGVLQKLRGTGNCVNFLCKLNIFMLADSSMKDDYFAEEINLINLSSPKFLKKVVKTYFTYLLFTRATLC